MTDERPLPQDEPLEGDIGPAAAADGAAGPGTALGASYDFGSPKERRAALRRYEAEREERRRRTDAVSGRIATMLLGVLLAFMTFDSGRTALEAHERGDDWLFPPGALAIACGIALVVIIVRVLRRGPAHVK